MKFNKIILKCINNEDVEHQLTISREYLLLGIQSISEITGMKYFLVETDRKSSFSLDSFRETRFEIVSSEEIVIK